MQSSTLAIIPVTVTVCVGPTRFRRREREVGPTRWGRRPGRRVNASLDGLVIEAANRALTIADDSDPLTRNSPPAPNIHHAKGGSRSMTSRGDREVDARGAGRLVLARELRCRILRCARGLDNLRRRTRVVPLRTRAAVHVGGTR